MQSTPLISNGRNLEDESQKIDVCTLFRVSLLLDITYILVYTFSGSIKQFPKEMWRYVRSPIFPRKKRGAFSLGKLMGMAVDPIIVKSQEFLPF